MADIELVIKIPEEVYKKAQEIPNARWDAVWLGIKHGTPLPKGHGRLIDVNSVYQIVRPIEPSDAEWGMTAKTAKQIIQDVFNKAPTVIEADREVEE